MKRIGPIFLLLAGCSADLALMDAFDENAEDTGSGVDVTDTDDDAAVDVPEYWSIEGTLAITDGGIATESTSLMLSFWFADQTFCADPAKVLSTEEQLTARPDESLDGWWALTLSHEELDDEGAFKIPSIETAGDDFPVLELGFGPFDDRLTSASISNGIDPDNTSIYGLYTNDTQAPERLLVFGVAGTDEQYEQPDAMTPGAPIADGLYRLTALYLFAY